MILKKFNDMKQQVLCTDHILWLLINKSSPNLLKLLLQTHPTPLDQFPTTKLFTFVFFCHFFNRVYFVNLMKKWTFIPDVVYDNHPAGSPFGTVAADVLPAYNVSQTASVTFWGANPRNNYMTQSTFLTIDSLDGSTWNTILVDGDWETKFKWKKHELEQSLVTIEWDISPDTIPGTYRITHQGYYKDVLTGKIKPYSGQSSSFTVSNPFY